jgi:C4-dicarboxylate transporter
MLWQITSKTILQGIVEGSGDAIFFSLVEEEAIAITAPCLMALF